MRLQESLFNEQESILRRFVASRKGQVWSESRSLMVVELPSTLIRGQTTEIADSVTGVLFNMVRFLLSTTSLGSLL